MALQNCTYPPSSAAALGRRFRFFVSARKTPAALPRAFDPTEFFFHPSLFAFFSLFPAEKSSENRVSTRNKENRAPGSGLFPGKRDPGLPGGESILMLLHGWRSILWKKRRTIFIEWRFGDSLCRPVIYYFSLDRPGAQFRERRITY